MQKDSSTAVDNRSGFAQSVGCTMEKVIANRALAKGFLRLGQLINCVEFL
jgi:hypothetical protein